MKPKAKVFLYFASIFLLVVLCIIVAFFAVICHSFLSITAVIVITAITTFFASSSKFAKEVKWIRRWGRVTKRPIAKYPQTVEQRISVRRELYTELEKRGMAFNNIKDKLDAAHMSHSSNEEIAGLQAQKRWFWDDFFVFWSVLRHVKSLPINLATGQPWKGKEYMEFLESLQQLAEFNVLRFTKARA